MDKPKLNVTIPEDAIMIIDAMTDEVNFAKKDTKIFIQCVNTLIEFIDDSKRLKKEFDKNQKELSELNSKTKTK